MLFDQRACKQPHLSQLNDPLQHTEAQVQYDILPHVDVRLQHPQ